MASNLEFNKAKQTENQIRLARIAANQEIDNIVKEFLEYDRVKRAATKGELSAISFLREHGERIQNAEKQLPEHIKANLQIERREEAEQIRREEATRIRREEAERQRQRMQIAEEEKAERKKQEDELNFDLFESFGGGKSKKNKFKKRQRRSRRSGSRRSRRSGSRRSRRSGTSGSRRSGTSGSRRSGRSGRSRRSGKSKKI